MMKHVLALMLTTSLSATVLPSLARAQTVTDTPGNIESEVGASDSVGMQTVGLNLPLVRAMALAAEQTASVNHTQVVVTIIDAGAHELLVERMPGAQLASLALAHKKAVSAVYYKRPSQAFEEALTGGKSAVLALPDAMPAAGGIPLSDNGQLVGAIGVSGGTNAQDQAAAETGMQVFQTRKPE